MSFGVHVTGKGSQVIDHIAEEDERYSGQVIKSLLSAIRLAHASLVKYVLRCHQVVPMAIGAPPPPGK